MSRLIKVLVISLGLLMIFSLNSFAQPKPAVAMVTGGVAGTYFPIGGAICEVINEALPDIEVTALTGNASVANINLIWQHEIESGLTQNNLADWAYNATVLFEGKEPVKNLRAIASLFPEHIHIVGQDYANINSVEDVRGKKISVSSPGSGGEADARTIFSVFGISFNDFEAVNLDQATSADYMKDKQLDGFWATGGVPLNSILDISQQRDITIVEFTDEEIEKIREKYPYYVKAVIPAGSYKGIDRDIQTVAVLAIWAVDEEVDEEVVYQITKALWRDVNLARIHLAHAKAVDITLETALDGISIPFHPGAARYYKEVGMWNPETCLE